MSIGCPVFVFHLCFLSCSFLFIFVSPQVIITSENVCLEMFEKKYLIIDQLNLAIFNNCQKIILKDSSYFKVCIFFMILYFLRYLKYSEISK